jgi:hypothetical protein
LPFPRRERYSAWQLFFPIGYAAGLPAPSAPTEVAKPFSIARIFRVDGKAKDTQNTGSPHHAASHLPASNTASQPDHSAKPQRYAPRHKMDRQASQINLSISDNNHARANSDNYHNRTNNQSCNKCSPSHIMLQFLLAFYSFSYFLKKMKKLAFFT